MDNKHRCPVASLHRIAKYCPNKRLTLPVESSSIAHSLGLFISNMVKLSGQTIIHHVSGSLMTDPKTRFPYNGVKLLLNLNVRLPSYFLMSILHELPYESPILGQILDLISTAKINISESKFKSYDLWDMAN